MEEAVSVGPALAWVRDVMSQWRQWMRAHLGKTILLSVLAFGFGWVWNTYIMAVDGGTSTDDDQTLSTAAGRPFNSLFWLLFFCLLSGLITYGWQRGWRNLVSDLGVIPRQFRQTMKHNPQGAIALLLWGVSASLIISTVISSAVSLALGLVLLTLAATPLGTIINFALIRLWKGLSGIVQPSAGLGAVLASGAFLVMVGEALGLLLDWMVGSFLIGLLLGIAAAVVSVLMARGVSPAGSGGAAAVLFGLATAASTLWAGRAWGDDGGWEECVSASGERCTEMGIAGIIAWFGSDGAGPVMAYGSVGGLFAGLGTAVGVGLGSVAASLSVAAASAAAAGSASGIRPPQQAGPPQQQPPGQQQQPPGQQQYPPAQQDPYAQQQYPPAQHDPYAQQQYPPAQQYPPGEYPPAQQYPPGQYPPAQQYPPGQYPPATYGQPTQPIWQQPAEQGGPPAAQPTAQQGGIPQQAGPADITQPLSGEAVQAGAAETTQPIPAVPQQPPSTPVEDMLPEAAKRERRDEEGRDDKA